MPAPNQFEHRLPYFQDSAALFAMLAHESWAIFLDSGYPYSSQGRYDIFAAQPVTTFNTRKQITTIKHLGKTSESKQNPFILLKSYLPPVVDSANNLPFNGGLLGYFAYDLARYLEKLPQLALDTENIPDMAVGIYNWAVVVDHQQQQSWLVGRDLDVAQQQQLQQQFSQLPAIPTATEFKVLSKPKSNLTAQAYQQAFEKIKYYLTAGDCYQINLTQRFSSPCSGDLWTLYQALRQANPAPFGAYFKHPELQILSASPERFLQVQAAQVETKPIKGTRPRKADAVENQAEIDALRHSTKDQAENVMIVDLLRNDISKTCVTGSVAVTKLFAIETYATVHHLVSTITATLQPQKHALDLLHHCFPGGSITGAPKIRAMEIIEELEPQRRGVYCGSLGYIGFNGNMDTNIAIRTFVHSDSEIRFWAGGGIVYDSTVAAEYQESFDKAAAMLSVLKQFANYASD